MAVKVDQYRGIVGDAVIDELYEMSEPFLRNEVLHVNSTSRGGGVAEILKSMIILMNDLKINAKWLVLKGSGGFFDLTKKLHNTLQGAEGSVDKYEKELYLGINSLNSYSMHLDDSDFTIIHDPQPLPLIKFYLHKQPWIWRCHIDLSNPNPKIFSLIRPHILKYKCVIVSMEKYFQPIGTRQHIIHPSIDVLTDKNRKLSSSEINRLLSKIGVDQDKPIVSQISRFDKFKDPMGVIRAFKIVRKEINCKLVYLSSTAGDDPEGKRIYAEVKKETGDDKDIILLQHEFDNSLYVNALQRASSVVLQKSIKEGFGLCVLPDTQILTGRGPRFIKNISKGEKVLAGDGKFHKVKDNISRRVKEYLEITAWKGTTVGVTREHPFLSTPKSRKVKITENDLKWRKANELSTKDFIAVPIPKSKKEDIVIDLAKYDKDILSDSRYVYYKFGFSGKRKFRYKNLSKRLNETKNVIEAAIRKFKENKTPRSKRQRKVIDKLAKIGFIFPEVEKVKRFISLNPEVQWFIGWYIAEGDTNGKMIEINANVRELNKVVKLQEIAKKYFGKEGTIKKRERRLRLIISSKILSKFFYIFGNSAKTKQIPDEWVLLGKNLKWLVLGLLEGDGIFHEQWACLNTISNKLAWQVWQILLADRVPSNISKENNFRGFQTSNPLFSVRFGGREYYRFCQETVSKFGNNPAKAKSRIADHAIVLDNFILFPIRRIKKINKKTKVYDISVEGTHSFVGNGYLLHNTVSEALWKGKPVIGGNVGGIPLQIINGENGFLVDSTEECAKRTLQLLKNPKLAEHMGALGKEHVRNNFLITRHLNDYLLLFKKYAQKKKVKYILS